MIGGKKSRMPKEFEIKVPLPPVEADGNQLSMNQMAWETMIRMVELVNMKHEYPKQWRAQDAWIFAHGSTYLRPEQVREMHERIQAVVAEYCPEGFDPNEPPEPDDEARPYYFVLQAAPLPARDQESGQDGSVRD